MVLLGIGILIFVVITVDFYYTTLSCNSSGFITYWFNYGINCFSPLFRNKHYKLYSGITHLFLTLCHWIFWNILAMYLINISVHEMVISNSSATTASNFERLYFTIYSFSTLGNGDLAPGSDFSRIATAVYSIAGFGMLTTGITYLLSITTAAIEKKNLATFIASMGKTPVELYHYFKVGDGELFKNNVGTLTEMINSHAHKHLCFPIIHYFLTQDRNRSVAIHLCSLYEALEALQTNTEDAIIQHEIDRLILSLKWFLDIATKSSTLSHVSQSSIKGSLNRNLWKKDLPQLVDSSCWNEEISSQMKLMISSQRWKLSDVYEEA